MANEEEMEKVKEMLLQEIKYKINYNSLTCQEIHELCMAYAELRKNDFLGYLSSVGFGERKDEKNNGE